MDDPATARGPAEGGRSETALVLGATGYVGRAVVAKLRADEVRTLAHVRHDSPKLEHWRARFTGLGAEVVTTPWDPAAFAELVRAKRVTRVFLCLGTTLRRSLFAARSGVPASYETVDLGLSALVIDACAASGERPRVVLLSAAGADPRARSRYFRVRGRLEEHLQSSGLEWAIARPGYVTGPGRDDFRPLERVGAVVIDGALLWLAVLGMQMLRERYRSIGAPELAKALVSHAFDPHSAGRILPGERLRDFP